MAKTTEQGWAETTWDGLLAGGLAQGGARRAVVELLGEQHRFA
jgi:hypothetical protein